jgi:hypothetical protein
LALYQSSLSKPDKEIRLSMASGFHACQNQFILIYRVSLGKQVRF